MVGKARPDAAGIARAIEHARQKRIAEGLPADDPSCIEYEKSQAEKKAKRQSRKGKT